MYKFVHLYHNFFNFSVNYLQVYVIVIFIIHCFVPQVANLYLIDKLDLSLSN